MTTELTTESSTMVNDDAWFPRVKPTEPLSSGFVHIAAEVDDSMLCVRRLSVMDKERLRDMFSRLSEESIYRRFHMPYPSVPEWMAVRLSDVDRRDTRTFIAIAGDEVVGHAMFVREGSEAEAAIVVEDRWQSKGVGKLLLFRLAAHARRRGVDTFTATVLGETGAYSACSMPYSRRSNTE